MGGRSCDYLVSVFTFRISRNIDMEFHIIDYKGG
jgi:hypothetical protein